MGHMRLVILYLALGMLPSGALALSDEVAADRASQFTVGTASADESFDTTEGAVYLVIGLLSLLTAAIATGRSLSLGASTKGVLDSLEPTLDSEDVR